ncbi:hypothetical protein DRJ22_04315 [Candidatus Woesearchaeota archaeon]|nr:MAG: hypothetical protein B6U93_01830 [Candidatus Woesearchaeota archaeon ex4484_78]RLE45461.1 MAG: hypothetical protein DRJ22_04315 [Candidatus Woesearchaeota archaeon]
MNLIKKALPILLVLTVFVAGFTAGGLFGLFINKDPLLEPQSHTITHKGIKFHSLKTAPPSEDVLHSEKAEVSFEKPKERISPYNWINEDNIELRQDGVFIHIDNPKWAVIADTNSMDPVIDENTHVIQIVPKSVSDIHVGDIISYASEYGFTIIHRVISTGRDEQGWYAVAKGDNNDHIDPWKIRFKDIKKVLVAIIY